MVYALSEYRFLRQKFPPVTVRNLLRARDVARQLIAGARSRVEEPDGSISYEFETGVLQRVTVSQDTETQTADFECYSEDDLVAFENGDAWFSQIEVYTEDTQTYDSLGAIDSGWHWYGGIVTPEEQVIMAAIEYGLIKP